MYAPEIMHKRRRFYGTALREGVELCVGGVEGRVAVGGELRT